MVDKGYLFISYSSKDSHFVEELLNILIGCNVAYWKAPEMIAAGSNYAREIPKAIHDCDVFLLVVSENSQNSIWVEKEVDVAICYRKRIIPIRIDGVPLNDMFRFYLNNVQIVEATTKSEEPIPEKVKERLQYIFTKGLKNDEVQAVSQVNMLNTLVEEKRRNKIDTRSNAFRINKIPLECEYCGGEVTYKTLGTYLCLRCGQENYDDFRKIRNYLEKVGSAPAIVVAKNTGVSLGTIEQFWMDEFEEKFQITRENNRGAWHSRTWRR